MTAYGTQPPTVRRTWPALSGERFVAVRLVNPALPRATEVVSGLRISPRYALALQVYRLHQRDSAGRCRSCGTEDCRSRGHAATIIAAAGVNPADVDAVARWGTRLRRQQRAFAARGGSPQRVKIIRTRPRPSQRRRGQQWPLGAMAPRGLAASAATATFVRIGRPRSAVSVEGYPLCGRLFCGCGQRFVPGSSTASGRNYVSLCGCRLWPINAAAIEQRVYAYATSGSSAPGFGAAPEVVAAVLSQFGELIEVGGTLDDIRFMRPT